VDTSPDSLSNKKVIAALAFAREKRAY